MDTKIIHVFFMLLFLIVGGLLFGISANTFSKMKDSCTASVIYDITLIVMVVGAILFTLAISFFFCITSSECFKENQKDITEFYLMASTAGSFLLVVLLIGALSKINDHPDCNTVGVKTNLWFMFALSMLCLLISGGSLGYIAKSKRMILLRKK